MSETTPAGNGYQRPWETLVDITREQTEIMTRMVMFQEQSQKQIEEQTCILREAGERMGGAQAAREAATQDVKACLAKSENWWRKATVVIAIAVVLANLIGLPIEKLLQALMK